MGSSPWWGALLWGGGGRDVGGTQHPGGDQEETRVNRRPGGVAGAGAARSRTLRSRPVSCWKSVYPPAPPKPCSPASRVAVARERALRLRPPTPGSPHRSTLRQPPKNAAALKNWGCPRDTAVRAPGGLGNGLPAPQRAALARGALGRDLALPLPPPLPGMPVGRAGGAAHPAPFPFPGPAFWPAGERSGAAAAALSPHPPPGPQPGGN